MIKVIFRKTKDSGKLVAIFPEMALGNSPKKCLTMSQDLSSEDKIYDRMMWETKPAKPKEYRSLFKWLKIRHCGNIVIVQKASEMMHEERKRSCTK